MSKPVLIFSGFNMRAVLAFLRTLDKTDVQYAVIAKSDEDEIFLSKYKNKVLAIRDKIELDIDDIQYCIKRVHQKLPADKYVIAPSTEALNRFLLDNKGVLEAQNCEIPLVNKELYERVSDKETFSNACKANGILVPEEYKQPNEDRLPIVAKPKKYYSTKGEAFSPVLMRNEKELSDFSNEHNVADFFYQQLIDGQSHYLLYYFYENGEIVKLSQINYVQQAEGKSIVAAEISDFIEGEESQKYEKLFKSLNFRGLVMIEVKKHKDKNYMIEANPRFWGPSQLFVDAEMNLFIAFLYDWGLIDTKPNFEHPKNAKYFWLGGMFETLSQNKALSYHSYTSEKFADDFVDWVSSDLYNRPDSRNIFTNQLNLNQ